MLRRQPFCGARHVAVAEQCAEAMGIDAGHMGYDRLAQSIPPVYSQLVLSQMCMAIARERFGAPAITFDEMRAQPARSRRTLAQNHAGCMHNDMNMNHAHSNLNGVIGGLDGYRDPPREPAGPARAGGRCGAGSRVFSVV